LFSKIGISRNGETRYFWEKTDFNIGSVDPMFPIHCATFVELRLQKMDDFYEKLHFTMENFKFWEAEGGC